MKLAVYSLKKILFQGDAESINLKTESGEITVLGHHRPLVAPLAQGILKILDKNQKEHYIPVSSGLLEVRTDNQIRLIVEE